MDLTDPSAISVLGKPTQSYEVGWHLHAHDIAIWSNICYDGSHLELYAEEFWLWPRKTKWKLQLRSKNKHYVFKYREDLTTDFSFSLEDAVGLVLCLRKEGFII